MDLGQIVRNSFFGAATLVMLNSPLNALTNDIQVTKSEGTNSGLVSYQDNKAKIKYLSNEAPTNEDSSGLYLGVSGPCHGFLFHLFL